MADSSAKTAGATGAELNTASESSGGTLPLSELMMAMDVVDTIRHRSALVERELNAGARDEDLIRQLKRIYAAQGIDVPESVLKEGVAALHEDRFKYDPPPPSLSRALAHFYVRRSKWAPPLLILVGLLGAIIAAWIFLVAYPQQRAIAELSPRIQAQIDAIAALNPPEDATARSARLAAEAASAFESGDHARTRKILATLEAFREDLAQEYELRVVADSTTGVWRVPSVNESARNYYIIVEAIAPDGAQVRVRISDEETGRVILADKWGLRVDEQTFRSVQADKRDDGIIQNNVFARKKSGQPEPEYLIPTAGGAILSW